MPRYALTPQAEADLDQLGDYLAAHDPPAALRLLKRLQRSFKTLATHPGLGRPRPDIAAGMRYLPVGWHLIFYQIQGERVAIIRVIDGRRDTPGLFHVKT